MNTAATNPPPRREGEIAINARLLYMFVGRPEMSYESWAASLHQMVSSRGQVPTFQIMTGDDGELALNVEFATYFAKLVSADLMGAIALITIEEGRHAAERGDSDCTNRMLAAWKVLALARGQMHATTLHAFLQVDQPYDRWLSGLKKKHGMEYDSDYIRVTFNGQADPEVHPRDTGEGEVMFAPRFAMTVAAEEPTRRGKLVRKYLENFSSAEGALHSGEDDLF